MPSTRTDRIDGISTSTAVKAPCRAATTTNITLSGEQTIDGVAIVDGDRVLVKDQTNMVNNGIYVASTGSWVRSKDFDGTRDVRKGTLVFASGGSVGGGLIYQLTTADTVDIGTDNITFTVLSAYTATAFIQTLLDDADAATARTTLGAQASDEFLTSIAALGTDADKMIYTTATNVAAETALTSFARTLLDDTTQTIARETLGITTPTRQYLTSGTAYTTPANVKRIYVRMVGAGGGGSAYITNAGADGGDTSFNSIIAKGGKGGVLSGASATNNIGTGTALIRIPGGKGSGVSTANTPAGSGGGSFFSSGADGGVQNAAGEDATGYGAGGQGASSAGGCKGSGNGGEYVEFTIDAPAASYTYAIGAAGVGGAAGTTAGGNGGSGLIIVEEYY